MVELNKKKWYERDYYFYNLSLNVGDNMNPILIAKEKEDKLREAACLGDVEAIEYLAKDTNVNAKHEINGW